jgi:putative membrane protein
MRLLRIAFWALVAAALVTLGLANRGIVRLRVLPEALGREVGVAPDIDLPLFLVILIGFALGMLVGFVWEWIREIPERAAARDAAREMERLRLEIERLKGRQAAADPAQATLAALPAR